LPILPSTVPEKEGKVLGKPTIKVAGVRVPGPLGPYAEEFWSQLRGAGYTPISATHHLRVLVHLSRWLEARQLSVGELTEERIAEYLQVRRPYARWNTRRGLALLLDFLAAQGATPLRAAVSPGLVAQELVASFERYLLVERRRAR
jgi:hypothetical protein